MVYQVQGNDPLPLPPLPLRPVRPRGEGGGRVALPGLRAARHRAARPAAAGTLPPALGAQGLAPGRGRGCAGPCPSPRRPPPISRTSPELSELVRPEEGGEPPRHEGLRLPVLPLPRQVPRGGRPP